MLKGRIPTAVKGKGRAICFDLDSAEKSEPSGKDAMQSQCAESEPERTEVDEEIAKKGEEYLKLQEQQE